MARSSIPLASPRHSLLSSFPLNHPCGLGDTLNNCVATLTLLAEFFSIKDSGASFEQTVSHGVWLLLKNVIDVLQIAAQVATVDSENSYLKEITLPFSESEYLRVEAAARHSDRTVEDYLSVLVREFVERFGEGVTK